MSDIEKAKQAVKTLMEIGKKAYNNPDSATIGQWFGMGVSKYVNDPRFLMNAAAEHCENWNWHSEADEIRKLL